MHLQCPLEIEAPVSPRLLAQLPEFQRIFTRRERTLRQVEVRAQPDQHPRSPRRGNTALFFSGGVDASHSLLEHESEISHLIFVHGFDIFVSRGDLYQEFLPSMQAAATTFGKELVQLETNLRDFTDAMGSWPFHFHGPVKAAAALALEPLAHRFLASGENISSQFRDSSRFELDPLWSTEAVEIVHVGHDVNRFNKLRRIGPDPRVQQHLRVCWENRGERYNCCECVKCLRNMCALRALGHLDQVTTFDRPLDLTRVAEWMEVAIPLHRDELRAIVEHLEAGHPDPELKSAVQRVLERYYAKERTERWRSYRSLPGRAVRKAGRLVRQALSSEVRS